MDSRIARDALRYVRTHLKKFSNRNSSRRQETSLAYNHQAYYNSRSRPFSFGKFYSKLLDEKPLLTKALTTGIIAGAGDYSIQACELHTDGEDRPMDWARTLRFMILGTFFGAPTNHYWYGWLAKRLPGQTPARISNRVAIDQFTYTPVWTAVWLTGLWTMEGSNTKELPSKMATHLPTIMAANWLLWIPAQYINFYCIPVKFQVLYINVVELVWNAFLSLTATDKGNRPSH